MEGSQPPLCATASRDAWGFVVWRGAPTRARALAAVTRAAASARASLVRLTVQRHGAQAARQGADQCGCSGASQGPRGIVRESSV